MIPLKDTVHSDSFPVVNTLLIAVNVVAFMFELSQGPRIEQFIMAYGMIPARLLYYRDLGEGLTLFTCMFLHAGWLHLLSNMLALYIFGDNVEDRMGSGRYLLFYLGCGLAAGLTHVWFNPNSDVPTVGASGAIAGVLGAYLILYPTAMVITLIPIFIFPYIVEIPAFLYLGIWFISQLLSGTASLGDASLQAGGGVAWWAHAGGFVVGVVLVFIFRKPRPAARRRRPAFADEYYPW